MLVVNIVDNLVATFVLLHTVAYDCAVSRISCCNTWQVCGILSIQNPYSIALRFVIGIEQVGQVCNAALISTQPKKLNPILLFYRRLKFHLPGGFTVLNQFTLYFVLNPQDKTRSSLKHRLAPNNPLLQPNKKNTSQLLVLPRLQGNFNFLACAAVVEYSFVVPQQYLRARSLAQGYNEGIVRN